MSATNRSAHVTRTSSAATDAPTIRARPRRDGSDVTATAPAILVVAGDRLLERALAHTFAARLAVRIAPSLAAARTALAALEPWCGVWMDLDLSPTRGFELIASVRTRSPRLPIALAATHLGSRWINRAFMLNAGLVYKPVTHDEVAPFVAAATAFAHRDDAVAAELARLTQDTALTPRQAQLAACVVTGTPRSALAADLAISANTLKSDIRRLLRKVGAASLDEVTIRVLRAAAASRG